MEIAALGAGASFLFLRGLQVAEFFFFQAEDGIRDGHVTGVQTSALPIFVLADIKDVDRPQAVADKVLEAARTPFDVGGVRVVIGASVGVALSRNGANAWHD